MFRGSGSKVVVVCRVDPSHTPDRPGRNDAAVSRWINERGGRYVSSSAPSRRPPRGVTSTTRRRGRCERETRARVGVLLFTSTYVSFSLSILPLRHHKANWEQSCTGGQWRAEGVHGTRYSDRTLFSHVAQWILRPNTGGQ